MNERTLLLANTYEPLKVISWQRAITLLCLGKVEVLESYDKEVRSTSIVFKMPAVARLIKAIKRHKKPVKFSRVNIYARDRYCCQYCGMQKLMSDLTYDHVRPRAQGGKTTWDNIVSSCVPCNMKKGDRMPEQVGMKLKKKPIQPRWVPALTLNISRTSAPQAWQDFLYWNVELVSD